MFLRGNHLRGIQGWLADRNIPVPPGSEVDGSKRPPGSPPDDKSYIFSLSKGDKVGRLRERAAVQDREVASIHMPDVYTDGSYSEEAPWEGFAGYRVWFGPLHPQNISTFLTGLVQTNHRAELIACIEALRSIHIITDSKYVYDGVTAHMHRWALQGRSVSNQDLWDSLRSLLRSRTSETLWKHVYSHVGVVGNEHADAQANLGRLQHPARLQLFRDLQHQRGLTSVVLSS